MCLVEVQVELDIETVEEHNQLDCFFKKAKKSGTLMGKGRSMPTEQ